MLTYLYKRLPIKQIVILKKVYYRVQKFLSKYFYSYNIEQLKLTLIRLGINRGDTLLVHSSFNYFNGFQGIPQNIISCLIEIMGEEGNLMMVSMPYQSSSYEYLKKNLVFDVEKTYSKMGILTEIFRRKDGVLRSLHPTHPVLAWGKDARWIVGGHEKCSFPCGKGSPFEKFRSLNGKVLFYDVPFNRFTFIHYIEDLVKNKLPLDLYRKDPMVAKTIDSKGNESTVNCFVFSEVAVRSRKPEILEKTF